MNWKRGLGICLLFVGLFLISTARVLTGAVVGLQKQNLIGIVGLLVFVVGIFMIFIAGREEGELERKLKQISDVKIRRELLSDAHRAKKFAEKGLDVNALWDENKSYEENKKAFFNVFYDNIDNEIIDNFWKYKYRDKISKKDFDENIEKYTSSEEFNRYKEKALRMIVMWNDKVLSGQFVPLYIKESREEAKDFPGKKVRSIYYGPKELKGRSNTFYEKTARKKGDIIVSHEIINPEAIENPDQLKEAPHIHWELEYIMNENYKSD